MGSAGIDIGSAVRKIREPHAIAFQGALKESPIQLVPLPPDEFISSVKEASPVNAATKKAAVSFDFSNTDSQSPTHGLGKELKALLDEQSFFDKKALFVQ